jgi:hypothetical protein
LTSSPLHSVVFCLQADLILNGALLDEYYVARDKALVPSRLDVSMTEASSMAVLNEPVPAKEGEPGAFFDLWPFGWRMVSR